MPRAEKFPFNLGKLKHYFLLQIALTTYPWQALLWMCWPLYSFLRCIEQDATYFLVPSIAVSLYSFLPSLRILYINLVTTFSHPLMPYGIVLFWPSHLPNGNWFLHFTHDIPLLGVSGKSRNIGGWVKLPNFCHISQSLITFGCVLDIPWALQINLWIQKARLKMYSATQPARN